MRPEDLKENFPIFSNQELIYLDNGATTQKPKVMIDAIQNYYSTINSNVGRGVYQIAELSSNAFEKTRSTVSHFIHAKAKNITFSSGCTASLNQAAYIIGQYIKPKQKIVLSILEHHANILPWQRLAKKHDLELIFIKDFKLLAYPELIEDSFFDNVAVLALTHVSNVTGQILPIKKWCDIANKHNIISVIDGAQGIVTELVNVQDLNCDFYAFSAHKLYGPMGVGVLYMKDRFLQKEPLILGGGIIEDVLENEYLLLDGNTRFEAGTPNVADVVAFQSSIHYLVSHHWEDLLQSMHQLGNYLYEQLSAIENINIVNNSYRLFVPHGHIISFSIPNVHAHDVGTFLSNYNIAVRVGKHCTHPLHEALSTNSTVRVSLGIYNTKEDIDYFITKIKACIEYFKE